MAVTQSLKELKAENADSAEQPEATIEPEQLDEEPKGEDVQPTEEAEQETAAEGEEPQVESWMQTEEEISDGKKGFKPNPEAAKVRKKLRAKLNEKDDELNQLKAEIEQLKSGQSQPQTQSKGVPPRPKREDFDFDDEKFDAAMDEWHNKRFDAIFVNKSQAQQEEQQKKAQIEAQQQAVSKAVSSHYERAESLVNEGKITEDAYREADRVFRQAVDHVFPGSGDSVTDNLINTLSAIGEGSEKVVFSLGVNASRLSNFQNLLKSDPSGMAAIAYLGKLQSDVQAPQKRASSAPKPGAALKGDVSQKGGGDAFHRRYKNAGSDVQKRISIKREAKRAGVDVSHW